MPLPPLPKRLCRCGCGEQFTPTRVDHVFANNSCKMRDYRRRMVLARARESFRWYDTMSSELEAIYMWLADKHEFIEPYFINIAGAYGARAAVLTFRSFLMLLRAMPDADIHTVQAALIEIEFDVAL